jgi:protein transport protein SEC31
MPWACGSVDEHDSHLSLAAYLVSCYSTNLCSCGKDNRTILWDLFTLRPIAEVPNDIPTPSHDPTSGGQDGMFGVGGLASSQQRRYDVQWSPLKRGVASTCSLDRKVQAHSILGLSTQSGRPPKWLRPSSSVSCGYGGSVISCGATDKIVRFRTVVEQPALAKASTDFEAIMASTNVTDFCRETASNAKTPGEAQIWGFMQVIFGKEQKQYALYFYFPFVWLATF